MSSEPVIKTCPCCAHTYTMAEWEALPQVAVHTLDWGEMHDMRNCTCMSSIVLILAMSVEDKPGVE